MTNGSVPAGRRAWNGDLVRSRFFDGISLLLPAAEAFLLATLAEWRDQVAAPQGRTIQADVARLLREETAHQAAHGRYNQALVDAHPAVAETAVQAARTADGLATQSLSSRLAVAAAFEYLTCLLSREMLDHPFLLAGAAPPQGNLWRWHAREELAHAHIVLRAAECHGLSRAQRAMAFLLATAYLGFDVVRFWRALCRHDVAAGAGRCRTAWHAARFLVGSVPSLCRMVPGWLGYFTTTACAFKRTSAERRPA